MKLKDNELLNITGGNIKITATLLNTIRQALSYFTDLGKSLGSSIRRIQTKRYC